MKQTLFILVMTLGMCVTGANSQTKKPVGKATTQAVPKDSREYKIDKYDGFEWYLVCKNGKYGAEDKNGNMLIPYEYSYIRYYNLGLDKYPAFFDVTMGDYTGAYSPDGRCIIPVSRMYTNISPENDDKYGQYYTYNKKDGMFGICDASGKQLFEAPYDELEPTYSDGKFYYEVRKKVNGKKMYGIIDGNGKVVIPLQENFIFYTGHEGFHKYINDEIKEENKVILATKNSISTTQHVLAANKSGSRPSSSNNSSNTNNAGGGTTKVIVEQHGPVQVWVQCGGCDGSGQCRTCFGTGTSMSGKSLCISCHGGGKCHYCAGKGGHYEVQYR